MAKVKMPFVWTGERYVRPDGRGIDLEGLAPPGNDWDRTDLGQALPEGSECTDRRGAVGGLARSRRWTIVGVSDLLAGLADDERFAAIAAE